MARKDCWQASDIQNKWTCEAGNATTGPRWTNVMAASCWSRKSSAWMMSDGLALSPANLD